MLGASILRISTARQQKGEQPDTGRRKWRQSERNRAFNVVAPCVDVRWRTRLRDSGRPIREMAQTLAEESSRSLFKIRDGDSSCFCRE